MRVLTAIAMTIALMTVPAYSQGLGAGGGKKHRGAEQKTDTNKKKADDKGYNAALSRLPNQTYDPWRGVR